MERPAWSADEPNVSAPAPEEANGMEPHRKVDGVVPFARRYRANGTACCRMGPSSPVKANHCIAVDDVYMDVDAGVAGL